MLRKPPINVLDSPTVIAAVRFERELPQVTLHPPRAEADEGSYLLRSQPTARHNPDGPTRQRLNRSCLYTLPPLLVSPTLAHLHPRRFVQ